MHQTTLERIEQELKKIKRQLQCGTQFFETVEEFPEVGVPCAIYVDKSSGAFYVYDTATSTYITADAGEDVDFSLTTTGTSGPATLVGTILNIPQYQSVLTNPVTGTGTAGQLAYWSGTGTQTGSNNLFWDAANGRLGIGTNAPTTTLDVNGTVAATTLTSPRHNVGTSGGNYLFATNDDGSTQTSNGLYNALFFGGSNTAGYGLTIAGFNTSTRANTSGVAGILSLFHGFAPTSGTGQFRALTIGGTINQTGGANGITRGLYVNPTLTAAADWRSVEFSNNTGWGLYGAGTANNYLAGRLGIGSALLTNVNLNVNKVITGASTSYSILNGGTIQSDVSTAYYFRTISDIQNTTFTLANLHFFNATAGGSITSATLTNQFGFSVNSSLTGATNNYGFYGDIASGTGRWNLYMNGTAANYLAGNTSIGTTTSSARLHVRGSGTTSATTALLVQNNGATELLKVTDDGFVKLGAYGAGMYASTSGGVNMNGPNVAFQSLELSTPNYNFTFRNPNGPQLWTSGTAGIVSIGVGYAPTSGTGVFNQLNLGPTINQTGGANGITRGLYVNPTLTSAAAWRSVEWSNNTGWGLYGAGSATNYLEGALTIGTSNISGSAVLQANSTTKGFLPPRMTTAQRDLIATPAAGLVIFNTTTTKLECFDGAVWQAAW